MKKYISDRVKTITPSMTLAITAKANQLKAQGFDVMSFGAGEPDFDTPEYIQAAGIHAIKAGFTRYTPASGIIELKKAIADKLLVDNGLKYEPDEIIVNCGAKHSISTALQAICNSKDQVIIPVPYWVSYPEMVKLVGAVPIFVETKAENNFKITKEDIKPVITHETKAIILNSPSNPTGAVYSKKELQDIAELAVENQFYVISDEVYEKLIYDDKEHISIASLGEEIRKLTIVINGMSKAFAMTGWRLGYTAANKDVISAMGRIQSHAISHPSSISQYAGVIALRDDEGIIEEKLNEFDKRRRYMIERLDNMENVGYIYPEGAFYIMVDVSKVFGRTIGNITINSSLDFSNAILEKEYVAVIPGAAFGADQYIRLSYATSMETIEEGLNRLERFIK